MRWTPARFWNRVDRSGECWLWTGYTDRDGYGQTGVNPTGERRAHRVAYVLVHGSIAAGLVLDHRCAVRSCVRPDHLEPVTSAENTRRSPASPATVNARKTHCKRGHEFTPENTRVDRRGLRVCRRCAADWAARHRAERGAT